MKRLLPLVCAALLISGNAVAADQASDALYKDAMQKAEANDYLGALESFKAAYARTKRPAALLGVATSLKGLGRFAEAADAYEQYLGDPQMNPALKEEVSATLGELLKGVAILRFDAEPNARVTIDARETKASTRVDPGAHVIVADDGTGAPITVQITVKAGEERAVSLRRKASAPPPVATGEPPKPEPKTPGTKTLGYVLGAVGIVGLGFAGYEYLKVKSGETAAGRCSAGHSCVSADDTEAANSTSGAATGFYIGAAVGVVALGAGAYFMLSNSNNVGVAVGPRGATLKGSF